MKILWDTSDLASFLNKSAAWTRANFVNLGIPGFKLGKHWRFDPDEVDLWIKNQGKDIFN